MQLSRMQAGGSGGHDHPVRILKVAEHKLCAKLGAKTEIVPTAIGKMTKYVIKIVHFRDY